MPAVSAFFSLAALAEVAAMENVHRYGFMVFFSHCCHRVWKASNMQCLIWPVSSSNAFSECVFSTTSLIVLTFHLHDNVIYFNSQ